MHARLDARKVQRHRPQAVAGQDRQLVALAQTALDQHIREPVRHLIDLAERQLLVTEVHGHVVAKAPCTFPDVVDCELHTNPPRNRLFGRFQ